MRLFFSIKAPEHPALLICRDDLSSLESKYRAVDPGLMHITLKFLGDTRTDPEDLIDALRGSVGNMPSFLMHPTGVGAFPGWKRASVLWIGFEDGGRSVELAHTIDSVLRDSGLATGSDKPYRPHMTLARAKHPSGTDRARRICEDALETLIENGYAIDVNELLLVSSTLTSKGPFHETTGSIRLKG